MIYWLLSLFLLITPTKRVDTDYGIQQKRDSRTPSCMRLVEKKDMESGIGGR